MTAPILGEPVHRSAWVVNLRVYFNQARKVEFAYESHPNAHSAVDAAMKLYPDATLLDVRCREMLIWRPAE